MSLRVNGSDQVDAKTSLLPVRGNRFSELLSRKFNKKNPGPPEFQPSPGSVGSLTRQSRILLPSDYIAPVHDALRKAPGGCLAVARGGRIAGFLTIAQIDAAIGVLPALVAPDLSMQPLSALLDNEPSAVTLNPIVVLRSNEPLSHVRTEFELHPDLPMIAVIAPEGHYVGTVLRSEMVAADLGNLAPLRVGGMATPLGVYLTDGVNQGGAGNLGLFLTGASMAVRLIAAVFVSNFLFTALSHRYHFDLVQFVANSMLGVTPSAARGIADDLQGLLILPILMLLIRLSPLAGIHAAEHQTVHAMERGEPLVPETVQRMPRAHPRCGTNLMAAVMIFDIAMTAFYGITLSISESVVPAILITLTLWRPIGTFLQNYLTTRPATLRQIESGIKAGRQVMQKHWTGLEKRPNPASRIWNMGLIQVLLGSWLVIGIFDFAVQYIPWLAQYVGRI